MFQQHFSDLHPDEAGAVLQVHLQVGLRAFQPHWRLRQSHPLRVHPLRPAKAGNGQRYPAGRSGAEDRGHNSDGGSIQAHGYGLPCQGQGSVHCRFAKVEDRAAEH